MGKTRIKMSKKKIQTNCRKLKTVPNALIEDLIRQANELLYDNSIVIIKLR